MKVIGYKIDDDGINLFYGFYLKVDIVKLVLGTLFCWQEKARAIKNPHWQLLTSQQSYPILVVSARVLCDGNIIQ